MHHLMATLLALAAGTPPADPRPRGKTDPDWCPSPEPSPASPSRAVQSEAITAAAQKRERRRARNLRHMRGDTP